MTKNYASEKERKKSLFKWIRNSIFASDHSKSKSSSKNGIKVPVSTPQSQTEDCHYVKNNPSKPRQKERKLTSKHNNVTIVAIKPKHKVKNKNKKLYYSKSSPHEAALKSNILNDEYILVGNAKHVSKENQSHAKCNEKASSSSTIKSSLHKTQSKHQSELYNEDVKYKKRSDKIKKQLNVTKYDKNICDKRAFEKLKKHRRNILVLNNKPSLNLPVSCAEKNTTLQQYGDFCSEKQDLKPNKRQLLSVPNFYKQYENDFLNLKTSNKTNKQIENKVPSGFFSSCSDSESHSINVNSPYQNSIEENSNNIVKHRLDNKMTKAKLFGKGLKVKSNYNFLSDKQPIILHDTLHTNEENKNKTIYPTKPINDNNKFFLAEKALIPKMKGFLRPQESFDKSTVSTSFAENTLDTKCSVNLPRDERPIYFTKDKKIDTDPTMGEFLHQLETARQYADNAIAAKDRLEKELINVREKYKELYSRYTVVKKQTREVQTLEMKIMSLTTTNEQMKREIDRLNQVIDERDHALLEKDQNDAEIHAENDKMARNLAELQVELAHLQQQLDDRTTEANRLSDMRRNEQQKDIKIRLMHNELVELKGNIRVLVRFRNIPCDEGSNLIRFTGNDTVQISQPYNAAGGEGEYNLTDKHKKSYTFNKIFQPSASQKEVYEEVSPYITSCIDGYNVCVMTYGQTGSGKTYTMKGTIQEPGIIGRSVKQLFTESQNRTMWGYKLWISILQIYNENLTDLLSDAIQRVNIQDACGTVYVKGLKEFRVTSEEDIERYINLGRKRCVTAKTMLNLDSSRSHFIVMLRIEGSSQFHKHKTQGILTMCDLAGFEKFTIDNPYGTQATESKYISKSLNVLARVFDALKNRRRSVPFRESKLTHLLRPSLSGEAKCVLVLTASSANSNLESSIRTLDFGVNAMKTALGVAKKNELHILEDTNSSKRLES